MPAPDITPLPPAPLRSQSPSTFTTTAEAFVAALPGLVTEINAFGDYLDASGVGGITFAPVVTEAGNAADLNPANAGAYQRWTNAAAKTLTVRDEADVPLPANGEWHIRNVGAADLTLAEDTAVTINPPADGTLLVPQGGTVTLKRVAADEFDLMGVTVPA